MMHVLVYFHSLLAGCGGSVAGTPGKARMALQQVLVRRISAAALVCLGTSYAHECECLCDICHT